MPCIEIWKYLKICKLDKPELSKKFLIALQSWNRLHAAVFVYFVLCKKNNNATFINKDANDKRKQR